MEVGSVVSFGGGDSSWRLVEGDAPGARAVSRARGRVVPAGPSGLFLPDESSCEAYISNQDGQWTVERCGEVHPVADQDQLDLSQEGWTLELTLGDDTPPDPTATIEGVLTHVSFIVSPDEEHVVLSIVRGGEPLVLDHRSHFYLLLLLARARIEDQGSAGVLASEHGWVETKHLAQMLKTTPEQVNVWIWRAREQFQKVDPAFAQRLVERRPTLGQLRIGFGSLSISR